MALTPCDDLSAAAWIANSPTPLGQLVAFGPAGFKAYARLRFVPDPVYPGQREPEIELGPDAPSEHERLRAAIEVLEPQTSTPGDCYFCLWDGWGSDIDGDENARIPPAFPPSVLNGPKILIPREEAVTPFRAYYLFHGSSSEFGDWGAANIRPGQPRHMPDPSFIWPMDQAWCIAKDVDHHFAGIGSSITAIDRLFAHPGLDIVSADPRVEPPMYQ